MKQVALGRKAWLFVSNVASGERSAKMMSLVSSARRHDLDSRAYIEDVLRQLLEGCTDYERLLPDVWKQSHPEAIRVYRQEERRDKADRKQYNAARRRKLRRPAAQLTPTPVAAVRLHLLGYAVLSLRLLGPERRSEIAEGLCAALSKLSACTYSIPQTLLDLLFPEPMPSGGWKEADFDDVQRASLTALLRTRHWTAWMISAKFLSPELTGDGYQVALSEFVSEYTKGEPLSRSEVVRRSGNVSTWDNEKHWP